MLALPDALIGLVLALGGTFLLTPSITPPIIPPIATFSPRLAGALPFGQILQVGRPVRLTIQGVTTNTAIEYVGLTSDGAMDVPTDPDNVSWYERGPRPGESGSAVIAGHYTSNTGHSAVFAALHTLRPGDKVYVEDDTGATNSFVVRSSRRYDPTADATDVFTSQDGLAHLNLITCGGAWDTTQQSYSHRLIVFTDREDEHDHF